MVPRLFERIGKGEADGPLVSCFRLLWCGLPRLKG